MKKQTQVKLGIAAAIIVSIISTGAYIVSAKFTGSTYENGILAQDESMQNTWAMTQQQMKMGGITVKNYGATFIKSLEANAKRYENDKGGMMKWVQEASGVMSPDLHKSFMNTIEKVYAKKEARQLSKISYVQEYRTWRTASVKGFIAVSFFDFPSKEVKKIEDRIISTKEVKQTWETGEDTVEDPFK